MSLLAGKVALVTGATKMKGLGKAVADRLVAEGATVVVTGREKSMPGAEQVVAALKAQGGNAMAVVVDVAHQDQVDAAVAKVSQMHGGVDILVNNAGIGAGSAVFTENDDRAWDANYAVNVKGTMAMCRGVLPGMVQRGGGAIVNVASMAGLGANSGMPYPYTATKFALVGVTKQLALEYASKGVRVNVVAPGAIATDMLLKAFRNFRRVGEKLNPPVLEQQTVAQHYRQARHVLTANIQKPGHGIGRENQRGIRTLFGQ